MNLLDESQLRVLSTIVRESAESATESLSLWLGRDVRVEVDPLEQIALGTAIESIGPVDGTVCACCMRVSGRFQGHLVLSFDDQSGLALCDALLSRTTDVTEWGELEISAAMESTNIVGCAFLNCLSKFFAGATQQVERDSGCDSLIPTPPVFVRDYAACIMQFILLDQASDFDTVLIAKTHFFFDQTPVAWQLILIPDARSLDVIAERLS